MTYTISSLCQLNGGCMGCCGHCFPSKKEIKKAIEENTSEFQESNPKTKEELIKFRDRTNPMDLRNGVCRNLIEKENQLICPLHPAQNQSKDLRDGHCDINHLCQTAKEFNQWSKEKQLHFIHFLENKKLDSLNYSIKMDNSKLLTEFQENESY